jgi:hypothetical protein
MLEFAIETLRREYHAAGQSERFAALLPGLRIGSEADEELRDRFRKMLRAIVVDTLADPIDVDSELGALRRAAQQHPGPWPENFAGLTPADLFARALPTPEIEASVPPAPELPMAIPVAAAAPVADPVAQKNRTPIFVAIGLAALPVAIAGVFIFRGKTEEPLTAAQRYALARAEEARLAALAPRPESTPLPRPTPAPIAAATPSPRAEPAPTPAPPTPKIAAATPTPATPAPAPAPTMSESAQWLAANDAKWQADFQRDVLAPFGTAVGKLRAPYLAAIDMHITTASAAGKRDLAVALRTERQLIASGQAVPDDSALAPLPDLKPHRTSWRAQFAKLDRDRFERARALHARYDQLLAQTEAQFTQQQKADDARAIKAKRDTLAAAWLLAPVAEPKATAPAPAPLAKGARLAPRELVTRLLTLHVRIRAADAPGRLRHDVRSPMDLRGENPRLEEIEFRPRADGGTLATEDDLALLDQLPDLVDLALRGLDFTDAALERVRACRTLRALRLEGLKKITGANLNVLATLPELRSLALVNLPLGDDAIATVAQMPRLTKVRIENLPLTDAALASLATMPALEDLEFGGGAIKITPPGWTSLTAMRRLTRFVAHGNDLDAALAALSRCPSVQRVILEDRPVTDAAIAPLSALPRLAALHLASSKVTGAGFKSWPVRTSLTYLNLHDCPELKDGTLRAIAAAFPRIEELALFAVPDAITAAGAAEFNRLRQLKTLRLRGGAVTDSIAVEIAKAGGLTLLSVGKSSLTETGLLALGKLPHLSKLELTDPPITDGALKAFKRMRALKEILLGAETQEAVFTRLRADLPGVTVRKEMAGK